MNKPDLVAIAIATVQAIIDFAGGLLWWKMGQIFGAIVYFLFGIVMVFVFLRLLNGSQKPQA